MSDESLGKRIRNAKLQKIPYLLVVGDKEVEAENTSVEHRDQGQIGTISVIELTEKIEKEIREKR